MPFRKMAPFYGPYMGTLYLSIALMFLYSSAVLIGPHLTADLINVVIRGHRFQELWPIVAAVVGLAVASGFFQYAQQVVGQDFGQKCTYKLREALYRRLQYHGFEYYDREHTGNLMQRLTGDVEAYRMFLTQGMNDATAFVFNIGFGIIAMLTLSVPLTLLTLAFLPFLAVAVVRFHRTVRPTYTLIRQAMSHLQTVVQESIAGVRTVKSFAREAHELAEFDRANLDYRDRNLLAADQQATFIPLIQFIGNVSAAALLWYGGIQVIDGTLSLGNLVAFFGLAAYLTGPIQQLGFLINLYAQAHASERRLSEILDTPDLVHDTPHAVPLPAGAARGGIDFDHVSFRYPSAKGSALALDDVTFSAPPGTVVGILGRTGSGKSSLVSLIPRFYDATSGAVRMDGCDIRSWTVASVRRQIGVVPGDTFLFSASVRENILYGRLDATDKDVEQAAEMAQAKSFIEALPDRYETVVGERGLGLSGGQRQRVALARALLFNPRILILDDATSSVDMETEFEIQQTLRSVMADRTTFIIAHRLSSLRRADLILVLDQGRIVERGRHEELLARNGLYREIFDVQFQDREALRPALAGRLRPACG